MPVLNIPRISTYLILTGIFCFAQPGYADAEKGKPNIIFILLDDLGKEWVGCYGAEGIETPRVDALAKSGMIFNNAYSMPQCTPSRACFMTGQYPYRNGWVNHWDVPRWGVGYFDWKKNPSVARVMKDAGYATAVAGKWQLNDFRVQPDAMVKHGFDEYCMWTGGETGNPASNKRYWDPYIHTKKGSKTYKGKFGPDIYNQFLLDFISKNKDKPFFIYYPMTLPHTPLVHTPLDPDVKDKIGKQKAMVRYIDHLTGKLVTHLESLNLRKNTIIVWTTDNGSTGGISNQRNGRTVKGGKTKTTENGVNAPFIVSCPGLVPKGAVSDALVDFTDMLPTFADFGGGKPEEGHTYDGVSVKDVFLGKQDKSERKYILAMGSHPARATDKGVENVYYFRDRVLREARYKLFVGADRKPKKLVDVIADPEESTNLMEKPECKKVLGRLVAAIEDLPKQDADPVYVPMAPLKWDRKRNHKSQLHKVGHPDNPNGFAVPEKKKRNKRTKK